MSLRPLLLGLSACALLALPALAETFNKDQKAEIEQIVRDYLLSNPDLVMEQLAILEQRRKDEEAQAQLAQERHLQSNLSRFTQIDEAFVGGNPDGRLTVVEFFDYNCGYCKGWLPTKAKLLEKYPDIRFVYREFPVLGDASTLAAKAAIAAAKQGKYRVFHEELMGARNRMSRDFIMQKARAVGLDTAQLRTDMESDETAAMLAANRVLAEEIGVRGTPHFIIGGQMIRGAAPIENFEKAIEEELAKDS